MSARKIHFFTEDIFFRLKNKNALRNWLKEAIAIEKRKQGELCYIFCSDSYLSEINKSYLKHRSLTDIITFDNASIAGEVAGDIYISIERLRENAAKFRAREEEELLRLMIHGILHLCGYKDKKDSEKAIMRKKEDAYIHRYKMTAV